MNNYIKIELIDSKPSVSMEYDSIDSFQRLMFCLISESGFGLVYKTIEKELITDNKMEEIEALGKLISLIKDDYTDLSDNKNKSLFNPSSFK